MKKQNLYLEFKTRAEKRISEFESLFFAFDKKQFEEGMIKIGLDPLSKNMVMSIPAGGFIKSEHLPKWLEMEKDTR
jgi:hypothetical protein